ncbi:MAG: hypothetical protein MUF68_06000, partial [Cyclobacteriaceae bacterium]|nr:hypothetical protein [Cyclobacteriaceae bacterium]
MRQSTIRHTSHSARLQILFILFLVSHHSFTQQALQVDLEGAKKSLQYERESIFINALHLSVSQAAVFHPIYVEYNNEKRVLDELLIKL